MKLRSLLLLPIVAALSLVSCTHHHDHATAYHTVYGQTYPSRVFIKDDPFAFGGHGGGYGNGYAIWPMPTDNYGDYGWFDDPYEWGSKGIYRTTRVTSYAPVEATTTATTRSYK
jgi:hypothetical protein